MAYHFFKDFDTTAEVNDRIRTTYDGPLNLAEDFMVWNVTKDDIRVRMAVANEEVWPPPVTEKPDPPSGLTRDLTEFWVIGRENFAASIAYPRTVPSQRPG